jgi:hypothetical protein
MASAALLLLSSVAGEEAETVLRSDVHDKIEIGGDKKAPAEEEERVVRFT